MYSLKTRIKKLEQHRSVRVGMTCPACGTYTGPKPNDIELVPKDTPPCRICGQPYQVTLNLGRRVLNEFEIAGKASEDETDLFINEIRHLLG
jgi:hypothetical protein